MSNHRPSIPGSRPSAAPLDQRGYQPKPTTGYRPTPQGGHQPSTGQSPPSNPPNQGSGGKK